MHAIWKKLSLLIIPALMLGGWFASCKKEANLSYVNTFLTGNGDWLLASLQLATYNGDSLKRTDTLNTKCTLQQAFTFSNDGSCVYRNFQCISQAPKGTWQLTDRDSIIIKSDIVCLDTSKAGSQRPFTSAQVLNLGQNSLILQVTRRDTIRKKPVLVQRRVLRYGFIH